MGVQVQTSDGTFIGSFAGIEQYSELLGEGRFLLDLLRSHAIVEAVAARYPDRSFHLDPKDPHRGLALLAPYTKGIRQKLYEGFAEKLGFKDGVKDTDTDEFLFMTFMDHNTPEAFNALGVLSPFEKPEVAKEADQLAKYEPHHFKDWADEDIWAIIREEYHNYFTRKGLPNQIAKTLFKLVKCDVVGLITDFAEIANINETVLLDDPNILYEPEKHGDEVARVFAEVELLERALSYRAELRVTAARLPQHLGMASRVHTTELTMATQTTFQDEYPGASGKPEYEPIKSHPNAWGGFLLSRVALGRLLRVAFRRIGCGITNGRSHLVPLAICPNTTIHLLLEHYAPIVHVVPRERTSHSEPGLADLAARTPSTPPAYVQVPGHT